MLQTAYDRAMHSLWRVAGEAAALLQGTYTARVLDGFWDLLVQLWYFAVLGAAITTLVWLYLPKAWLRESLRRHARFSVLAAVLLGLVSPLCTFAAIPLVGSLIVRGAPAVPLVAFMVTSPLMNPALFLYTAGILDTEMALARVVSAASVGLAAAGLAHAGLKHGALRLDRPALEQIPAGIYTAATAETAPFHIRLGAVGRRFAGDLSFIGRYFLLGIFIAALVKALLDEGMVYAVFGAGSAWAVPAGMALGIPLYACGGGSLPVVEAMVQNGMTSGAALAFFISGPATKFSTITMLGAVFGRRMLLFYLGLTLTAALLWGYLYPFSNQFL